MSVACGRLVRMTPWTPSRIEAALRASWAADTCSPDDVARAAWTAQNPSWGQCDITALVINDLFGGDLMCGEVELNGEQQNFHWWNRRPSGIALDLTREQFRRGQSDTGGRAVQRPEGRLPRRWEEYLLLRSRVETRLGAALPTATGMGGRA